MRHGAGTWHSSPRQRAGTVNKGGLSPREVDLGFTAAQSGDKGPIDSFHALVWVQFAEYLQHGYLASAVDQLNRDLSLPKVSDVGMACCSISD